MPITSMSFTFVSMVASSGNVAAVPAPAQPPAPAPSRVEPDDDAPRRGGGQNRLAAAMVSALRELGLGSAATSTATPAAAPTNAAQPTPASDATVDSAVQQFAHELFQAMRQVGRGDAREHGGGHDSDDRGHHHHARHAEGYGGWSQRLAALARSVSEPVATPAAPATTAASAAATTATTTTATPATTAPAVTDPATKSQPATSPANPLLDAFAKLWAAIAPPAVTAPTTDMAGKLREFLQSLAQSLRPGSMEIGPAPHLGCLVHTTA